MSLPAVSRGISFKVKFILSQQAEGTKLNRFRIAHKVIKVIRVICEISGSKRDQAKKRMIFSNPSSTPAGSYASSQ